MTEVVEAKPYIHVFMEPATDTPEEPLHAEIVYGRRTPNPNGELPRDVIQGHTAGHDFRMFWVEHGIALPEEQLPTRPQEVVVFEHTFGHTTLAVGVQMDNGRLRIASTKKIATNQS